MRRRNNTVNPAEILPGCRRGEPRRRQKRCYFRSLPLPGLDQDPAAGNDQRGRRSGDRAIGGQSVRAAIERKVRLEPGDIRHQSGDCRRLDIGRVGHKEIERTRQPLGPA